jgi:uncharacterized membrane protein
MTKTTPSTNTQARHKLAAMAPIVLFVDIILAAIIWFMKDSIFNEESNYLAGLICAALLIAGIFSFFVLRMMAHKITRADRVTDHDDNL